MKRRKSVRRKVGRRFARDCGYIRALVKYTEIDAKLRHQWAMYDMKYNRKAK